MKAYLVDPDKREVTEIDLDDEGLEPFPYDGVPGILSQLYDVIGCKYAELVPIYSDYETDAVWLDEDGVAASVRSTTRWTLSANARMMAQAFVGRGVILGQESTEDGMVSVSPKYSLYHYQRLITFTP